MKSSDQSLNEMLELRVGEAVSGENRVATSGTSAALLAANPNRIGATIHNDAADVLYVRLSDQAASPTAYAYEVPAGSHLELPGTYSGALTGTLASGSGNAQITEW